MRAADLDKLDATFRRRVGVLFGCVLVAWLVVLAIPVRAADANDETVALEFVRANHAELADVLASLKPMRPDDYKKAVRDLAQVSRALTKMKSNDSERYALGLEAWKARSRVDLLAARLASAVGSTAELESDLRRAVGAQLDVEIRQQRHEKQVVEQRLKKVTEILNRLESDALADSRYQTLVRRSQIARRKAAAPTKAKAKPKPNAATGPDGPTRGADKGENPR